MTLIAAQIAGDRIEILADGLSCHDKLTIARSRQIGANAVQSDVPGRTTLQKVFPHPHLAFAIAHCGSNQRNGTPIRIIVEGFWRHTVSERLGPEYFLQLFEEEFGSGAPAETFWLLGWQASGTPIVHVIGTDCERLDGERYWGGTGRNLLSSHWTDLLSLKDAAERFLGESQKQAPFKPFFANCYGGHWHRLQLTAKASPQWLTEPCRTGVEVSALLPGPARQPSCSTDPANFIATRGEGLKVTLRGTFDVATVRGALKRMPDDILRERCARLIAIFDEVKLDSEIATVDDAARYTSAVDDAIVRMIEREVLDVQHKQFDLLRRNDVTAIYALLQYYAQLLRGILRGKYIVERANEGLRGLAHCLRWIKACCPSALIVPTPAPDALEGEALNLLRWGVDYDPIWNQHSAYSRRVVEAEVDERNKVITFLPRKDVHPRFFCTQIEAKKADDERLAGDRPDSQLAALSNAWYDSVGISGQRMRFDDSTIPKSGAIDVAFSWMEKACLPELAGATRLMGCTVADLRRVLATLYVYSLFTTKLEDVADRQGSGIALRPFVVARRRDQMIAWLAGLSSVPAACVDAILSVLTFDPTHPHVTLAQQPLVSSSDGQLLFLPAMLLFLDLPRMYVGALNKDRQGRAVYAKTIIEIEAAGVESIASEIRAAVSNTLHVVANRTFGLPDGRQITPDIVIVSERDRSVLVIDVKYATPPFGPADIQRDVEEMGKWKARMAEYVASFEGSPEVLAQHFQWACQGSATVVGLILTRWPFPIPIDIMDQVGAVDWPSLREHIQQTHPSSICDLTTWAANRPDMTVPSALVWTAKQVRVGEWKYGYSVLAPLSGDRLLDLTQRLAYRLWEERGRPFWDDLQDWYEAKRRIAADPYLALEP